MAQNPTRIFALDPTTKGLGYVVFELPFRLVEWGLTHVTGDKYAGAIARFQKLLDRFRPDTVVLEDPSAPGSRRSLRVRDLIQALVKLARERGVVVVTVARSAVLKCFSSEDEPATKQSIAERLTKDFPELTEKLPLPRKPWESEAARMSIFDALALAVTYATG